jgi:hypothetical protein
VILTDEIFERITTAIGEHPDAPVILPDWCYWKGRDQPVVYVDGLPENLSRVLYRELIGELGYSHHLVLVPGTPKRNVNPHLFTKETRRIRSAARCPNGHLYAGNEMPENRGRWRCVRCYKAWQGEFRNRRHNAGEINRAKQFCPRNHEYAGENLVILRDGRRRCRTCHREQMRAYRTGVRPTASPVVDLAPSGVHNEGNTKGMKVHTYVK